MVALAFNAQQHEPKYGGGGGLSVGRHRVIIVDSEGKPSKPKASDPPGTKNGYLEFTLKDIDNGQTGADRLSLWHSNPLTVDIANKQLSAICHAVNVFNVQDTAQLHNIPFQVEVAPQESDPKYTQVVAVYDINGNAPGTKPAATQAAAAPAAPAPAAWPGTAAAAEAALAGWPGATVAAPAAEPALAAPAWQAPAGGAAAAPVAPWAK